MKKTNADRFISAYNDIDYSLRTIYDFKRSMSFSDMIRRSVVLNAVVRKYEEDLIDFGRLRNAIIHNGNKKYTIAEPHDDIVEKIEKLAELISEPPKALDRVGNKEIVTVDANSTIAEVMKLVYRTGYSNIPVYDGDKLKGIMNTRKLINVLGKRLDDGENIQDFIVSTKALDILEEMDNDYYFMIADENLTIDSAMNYFESHRKLMVILITKDGKDNGKPLKIITSADIIDMKKILDVY